MALNAAQLAQRAGKITASFAPQLLAGDTPAIHNKWLELIGDPTWVPEDLSNEWAPAWGAYGEPFILDWHERKTAHTLHRRGEVVQHPTLDYVACTLDAYRAFDDCVIDAKVSGAYIPIDAIIAYYTPQLIVQRACVGAARAALLIVHGSAAPHEYEIIIDEDYERIVWQRIAQFKHHVDYMIPPVTLPRIVPPEQWRSVDLDSASENWAPDMRILLASWDRNHDPAKLYAEAAKRIKELMPDDVGTVLATGISIKRNRANAITIKRTGES